MIINSDINILGGLPDFNLVVQFLNRNENSLEMNEPYHTYTSIKTDKSVQRFAHAINRSFLIFKNKEVAALIKTILAAESISSDSMIMLFWHASFSNELFYYLNNEIYFPAFYSGRISIKQDEAFSCLKDLRESEIELRKWSKSTLETTASKYLTLLKKFHLMEGSLNKKIIHPYLNDKMFILFVYWLTAVESKSNLLESEWLKYSFCERPVFIERLMQKKFANYFQLSYTGDKLSIETILSYSSIYHAIK